MIPIRLKMTNFLPYCGTETLMFEGIHLACLTGANGAGKSSLLDAITWVLWGESRAKDQRDLIHSGQTKMEVELDFEHEGVLYRVRRTRNATTKSSNGDFTWHVLTEHGAQTVLNEPSQRETQARLTKMLKLDYDTFVASAFLQQGKADSFTVKTPAERKRVLSDILGLDRWQTYEERVKTEKKELEATLRGLNASISDIDEELAQEPALIEAYQEATKIYVDAQEALQHQQALVDELANVPTELRYEREKEKDMREQHNQHRTDLAEWEGRLSKIQQEIKQDEALLAEGDAIREGYSSLQTMREQSDSLSEQLRQVRTLENERAALIHQIEQARSALAGELQAEQARMVELERKVSTHDVHSLSQVAERIHALEALEAERETLHAKESALKEERGAVENSFTSLKQEGESLKIRLGVLEQDTNAVCPLCGNAMSSEHRQTVLSEMTAAIEVKRKEWTARRDRQREIDLELKGIEGKKNDFGAQLKDLPRLRNEYGKLQKQQQDANEAAERLNEVKLRADLLLARLENRDYAPEWHTELAQIDGKLRQVAYDASTHEGVQEQLKALSVYEQHIQTLLGAESRLPKAREAALEAENRLARLHKVLKEETTKLAQLADQILALEEKTRTLYARQLDYKTHHDRMTIAKEKHTNLEQELKTLENQKAKRAKKLEEATAYQQTIAYYNELQLAFSKNGVPAMMIESAIPELEAIANDLLARMTDGRMHLRLKTQRETQAGNQRETLEIDIADELGTRPYELYSGGEAFRINFALRVALSKLLARRAGAQLQTLFIDEGFGTQDDNGRQKLVEAITAIQDDFRLILVITHLEDLRDAFPVHIVVQKTSQGSHITMR